MSFSEYEMFTKIALPFVKPIAGSAFARAVFRNRLLSNILYSMPVGISIFLPIITFKRMSSGYSSKLGFVYCAILSPRLSMVYHFPSCFSIFVILSSIVLAKCLKISWSIEGLAAPLIFFMRLEKLSKSYFLFISRSSMSKVSSQSAL